MISNDSEERGKELRSSLEHECARLRDTKTLRPGPLGNDVANVVAEYIPVGTAFSDAESSLRSAGFTVYPRPSANPPGNRGPHSAFAGRLQSDSQHFGRFIRYQYVVGGVHEHGAHSRNMLAGPTIMTPMGTRAAAHRKAP